VVTAVALIAFAFFSSLAMQKKGRGEKPDPGIPEETIRMAICKTSRCKIDRQYFAGYDYYLLESFALSEGLNADITVCDTWAECLYRLKGGEADIISIPAKSEIRFDGLLATISIDKVSRWIMRSTDRQLLDEANYWIDDYNACEEKPVQHNRFLSKSRKDGSLSPYDSLLRAGASRLGWDWKMFAALVYQESRFHIEAKSHRGAKGLCQLMPATARQFKVKNIYDPEQNISAGVKYLRYLLKFWREYEPEERLNFTLASFNGGPGLVLDAMDSARKYELDPDRWESVREAILTYADTTNADSGRKWKETAEYVDKVKDVYWRFSPSSRPSQDQSSQSPDTEATAAEESQ